MRVWIWELPPDAKNFREWLGLGNKETWDDKKFDLNKINKSLSTCHDVSR